MVDLRKQETFKSLIEDCVALRKLTEKRNLKGVREVTKFVDDYLNGEIHGIKTINMDFIPGGPQRGDNIAMHTNITWRVLWGECGYPSVIVKPRRAAYFASTNIRVECATMLEPPWPAFYVHLPDCPWTTRIYDRTVRYTGLMVFGHVAEEDYSSVVEGKCKAGDKIWSFIALTETADAILFRAGYSYNWNSAETDPFSWDRLETVSTPDAYDIRMNLIFCQFIAGIALEFQTVDNIREDAQRRSHSKANREIARPIVNRTPKGAVYLLGDDVTVDVRPVIADYVRGNGKSPTVRSWIRPYPKQQPYGPERSLRKLIRVEGHWRGAAGAPINIRSHKWKDD